MRKFNLKPSPATFVEIYRGLDENHKKLLFEDLKNKNLQLSDSNDFYDFYSFIYLIEKLETDSAKDLDNINKQSIFERKFS